MAYLKLGAAGIAVAALVVSIAPLCAQQQPVRVRGTIEKVDGSTLTVKDRDAAALTKCAPDGR